MPLKLPTELYAESISSKNLPYKSKKSIWANYNTALFSNQGPATLISNPQIQAKLTKVREICAWHEDPRNLYVDYDRDLYQACHKQCERLATTAALYVENSDHQEMQQNYLNELKNLDVLADFAKDINQYNTLSRLLLVLGSILAIGYACAFPVLAAPAVVNALVMAAFLTLLSPFGILWVPIGLTSGLTTMGTLIVVCLGIGTAMNLVNPSPQGSKELVEAMKSLKDTCLHHAPAPTLTLVLNV